MRIEGTPPILNVVKIPTLGLVRNFFIESCTQGEKGKISKKVASPRGDVVFYFGYLKPSGTWARRAARRQSVLGVGGES